MKTRILSGLLLLPLLLLLLLGGRILLIGCFIIGAVGVKEFYRGFENMGVKPSSFIANISILGLYAINIFTSGADQLYMLWFAMVVFLNLLYLFKIDQRQLADAMATMVGIFYIIYFSYHFVLIDQIAQYGILVWLVLITAFGTDTMAYFTGYALGKHKLCPRISPKKTIEGSIGGILGSVIFSGIFGYFIVNDLLIHCIIIGVLGGVVSQLGDLSASIFKRKMGIKDYGNLIPGHGGILDRFDSVLFTAPMVYYYIIFVLR